MAQTVVFVASLVLAGMVSVQGLSVDCETFNPLVCKRDAIPFCLVNGTVVTGSCFAEKAQCLDKVMVDDTFSACPSQTSFDCTSFNPLICQTDAIQFCLTNGTVILGKCHAQRAVCLENKQVDGTFHTCNHRGKPRSNMGNVDGSSSTRSTANVFMLMVVFMSTILH